MKIATIACLLLLNFSLLKAQKINDFFNSSEVTVDFVGLDFSKVKLIGSEGFKDPEKIQSYYFPAWNGLLISEIDKYDIKKALYKDVFTYHLNVVENVNKDVKYLDLVTNSTPADFSEQDLQTMVKAYDTNNLKNEYGVSFIIHSLNKLEQRANIYIVIFNPKNKEILFSEKVSGEPRGFGFRNYWAGAIYDIIKEVKKKKFKKWRKAFSK